MAALGVVADGVAGAEADPLGKLWWGKASVQGRRAAIPDSKAKMEAKGHEGEQEKRKKSGEIGA